MDKLSLISDISSLEPLYFAFSSKILKLLEIGDIFNFLIKEEKISNYEEV